VGTTVIKLEANLEWLVGPVGQGSRWMAVCEPMDLAIEALTQEELPGMINETLQLVLTELLRENELDSFLTDRGWTARNLNSVQPDDDVEFEVPWTSVNRGSVGDIERVLN
jgi:hypothetical protein